MDKRLELVTGVLVFLGVLSIPSVVSSPISIIGVLVTLVPAGYLLYNRNVGINTLINMIAGTFIFLTIVMLVLSYPDLWTMAVIIVILGIPSVVSYWYSYGNEDTLIPQ